MALTQVKGSILSDELYRRENNLSDVQDKAAGRNNLGVYGKSDVYQKSETYGKSENYSKGETYSRSEMDSRFLNESSNLSDLDSTYSARSNLSVYSKSEVDSRIPIVDYALLDFGSINKNTRYKKTSPFGNAHVFCEVDILAPDGVTWFVPYTDTFYFYQANQSNFRGVEATYFDGDIVVRTLQQGVASQADHSGSPYDGNHQESSAGCRVHVWRCGQ